MAYGLKYKFVFQSTHGVTTEIDILKNNYSGTVKQRALGRAPVLKKQKSGNVCGTSLDFYAECSVAGEFAELYTSDPKEYKVQVQRGGSVIWSGFVNPELYSEPDIAPPYDVNVTATDGIGELKLYSFELTGRNSLSSVLQYLLGKTGLDTTVNFISRLRSSTPAVTAGAFLGGAYINLEYMNGKTCYEVLQYILDTLHASITRYRNAWLIARETDITFSGNNVQYYNSSGTLTYWANSKRTYGQMGVKDLWPIGNTSTKISPAKNAVTVKAPWHSKSGALTNPDITSATGWTTTTGVTYDSSKGCFTLLGSGSTGDPPSRVYQNVSGITLDRELVFTIRVANTMASRVAYLDVTFVYNGTTYYLINGEDGPVWSTQAEGFGKNYRPTFNPVVAQTEDDAGDISFNIPPYIENSVARTGTLTVGIRFPHYQSGYAPIMDFYRCSLSARVNYGYQDIIKINNGARGSGDDVEIAHGRVTDNLGAASFFLQGILTNSASTPLKVLASNVFSGLNFLSLMSRDYALSVALPRLVVTGTLDYPGSYSQLPLVLDDGNVKYWIDTYDFDLYNDEIQVEAISLPAASLTVTSEDIRVIEPEQGTAQGGGSTGGGGVGGGVNLTDVAAYLDDNNYVKSTGATPIKNIQVVTAYPATLDSNTLYILIPS